MSQKFRFNIPHDYALDLSIEPELEGMVYSGPNGSVSIGFENLDKQSISDSIQSFSIEYRLQNLIVYFFLAKGFDFFLY